MDDPVTFDPFQLAIFLLYQFWPIWFYFHFTGFERASFSQHLVTVKLGYKNCSGPVFFVRYKRVNMCKNDQFDFKFRSL